MCKGVKKSQVKINKFCNVFLELSNKSNDY